MDHTLVEKIFEPIAFGVDLIGIIILLWGFVLSFIQLVKWEFSKLSGKGTLKEAQKIRRTMGTYILIGLEFMIVSDIIHTFVTRTKEDLMFLGAIVIIRTAISFFLGRELEQIETNEK